MRVTVDTNVLVYAANESCGVHRSARGLDERLGRGPEIAYLFWPVLSGFLRIAVQLVALMRQHGVRLVYTRDRGYRRFDGIEVVDPVAGGTGG